MPRPKGLLALCAIVFSCAATPAFAQNTISVGSATASTSGGSVQLLVELDHTVPEGVGGFSFGLDHDELTIDLVALSYVGPVAPDFLAVNAAPGDPFATIGVIFSTGAPLQLLSPGNYPLALVDYDIPPAVAPGPQSVEVAEVGTPPIAVELATPVGPVIPDTVDGVIQILASPGGVIANQLAFPNGGDDTVSLLDPAGVGQGTASAGGQENPTGVAVAPNGSFWVTFTDTDTVVQFDSSGTALNTVATGDQPTGVAVDFDGNAWVTNLGDGSVSKIAPDGTILLGGDGPPVNSAEDGILGAATLVGDLPAGIAIDFTGSVWVAAQGIPATTPGAFVRLSTNGAVAVVVALENDDEAFGVATDRAGLAWFTLSGLSGVEVVASDGSEVEFFDLPGATPTAIAIRRSPDTDIDEAWVAGSADGNVYRLIPGGTIDAFVVGTTPSGVAVDGNGDVWVTDSATNSVSRLDGSTGVVEDTFLIGNSPGFLGDASGYVQAAQFFKEVDLDLDGFETQVEIEVGTNPFDAGSNPSLIAGFVDPVAELACVVTGGASQLGWVNVGAYDSIRIDRTDGQGTVVSTMLSGTDTSFSEPLANGAYLYQVFAGIGADESAPRGCAVAAGPGNPVNIVVVEIGGEVMTISDITLDPNPDPGNPKFYVTDAGDAKIYGLDENFDVVTVIDSPYEVSSGIAFDPDGEDPDPSLYVANGAPNVPATIQEITTTGEPTPTLVELAQGGSPIEGPLGSMHHVNDTNTLLVVGPEFCEIYAIQAVGGLGEIGVAGTFPFPTPGFGLDGIYAEEGEYDTTGGMAQIIVQDDGDFMVAEVVVAMGMAVPTGQEIPLNVVQQDENSIGGIVFADDMIIVVGGTTGVIYELEGAPAGPQFVRGDVTRDGILALNDAILELSFLFQSGFVPCQDAADINDDGLLALNDAVLLLAFLFTPGGSPPAAPYPDCGIDATVDMVGCDAMTPCISLP